MSTRAQILAEIAARFPDNTTGLITPAKLRQVVEDIANSYNNLTDEPAVPTSRTVNGHALSSNVTVTAADVGLGSVENTALSTWTGSANLATVGTITAGTWHGSAIADTYISSAAAWNAKVSFPGFGTTAGTAAEGNDARLSDARTPLAHNQAWSTITSTPTTLSGYGITDAQGLDSDLTALAGLSTTGLVARTGSGTAATRTITGTTDQITVTNGDGVSGNPTLSLPQSIATASSPTFSGLTLAPGSAEFPTGLTIKASTHATSRRAAFKLGNWLILQDSNGSGTKNFALYDTGASKTRIDVSTTGGVQLNAYGAGTLVTDSSGNITTSSDRRLKNVSGRFTRGLDAILQIQPKVFTWKPESGMNTDDVNVGFIAQDVQGAIPEAVGTMKTTDYEEDDAATGKKARKSKREAAEYLTLSDRPIIAALVNAVKELKAENDTLRARVSALENGKAAK